MERATESLIRSYVFILGLSILILVFTVYVYLFPTPFTEYFINSRPQENTCKYQ